MDDAVGGGIVEVEDAVHPDFRMEGLAGEVDQEVLDALGGVARLHQDLLASLAAQIQVGGQAAEQSVRNHGAALLPERVQPRGCGRVEIVERRQHHGGIGHPADPDPSLRGDRGVVGQRRFLAEIEAHVGTVQPQDGMYLDAFHGVEIGGRRQGARLERRFRVERPGDRGAVLQGGEAPVAEQQQRGVERAAAQQFRHPRPGVEHGPHEGKAGLLEEIARRAVVHGTAPEGVVERVRGDEVDAHRDLETHLFVRECGCQPPAEGG